MKCQFGQKVFGTPVTCLIEDCERCIWNPDYEKASQVLATEQEEELAREERAV